MISEEVSPKRSSKPYDIIKQMVEFGLPATGALYFGLAQIWGFPGGEKVVGTLAVLATFLGGWLKISRSQYYNDESNFDGKMVVSTKPEGGKRVSFETPGDPMELLTTGKKSVEFKVALQDQSGVE